MEAFLRFILILILTIEVFAIVRYERKKFDSFMSPGTLLSVPLYVVVLLAYVLGGSLGYIQIALNTLLVFVLCIPYFAVVGNMFAHRFKRVECADTELLISDIRSKEIKNHKIARNSAIVGLVFLIISALIIFVIKPELLSLLGTDKFGEELSAGIPAHIFVMMMLCAIIILATFSRRDWYVLIIFTAICAYAMLLGVKYNLVIILLGGLILRIMNGKMKLKFSYCVITAVVIFILCIGIYVLEFYLNGEKISFQTFVEVFKHLMKYLFSGVLAMGETIEKTVPSTNILLLFRPVITIFNFATFGIFDASYPVLDNPWNGWVFIGVDSTYSVNVSSFFGAIYFANGILGLLIVVPIISIIVYSLFSRALKRNSFWLKAAYVAVASPLVLSWFGYYYNLLTFYELFFYCILFYFYSRIRENSRNEVFETKLKESRNDCH